jgi:hypothetical protein
LFGIVGLTLVLRRRSLPSWDAFFRDRGVRSIFINIAIWTALGLTAIAMDNYAHGGGLIVGALAAWVITERRAPRFAWGAFAVAFALLFVAALRPWWRPTDEDAKWVEAYAEWYRTGQELPMNPARARRIAERGCGAGVARSCDMLEQLRDPSR